MQPQRWQIKPLVRANGRKINISTLGAYKPDFDVKIVVLNFNLQQPTKSIQLVIKHSFINVSKKYFDYPGDLMSVYNNESAFLRSSSFRWNLWKQTLNLNRHNTYRHNHFENLLILQNSTTKCIFDDENFIHWQILWKKWDSEGELIMTDETRFEIRLSPDALKVVHLHEDWWKIPTIRVHLWPRYGRIRLGPLEYRDLIMGWATYCYHTEL